MELDGTRYEGGRMLVRRRRWLIAVATIEEQISNGVLADHTILVDFIA